MEYLQVFDKNKNMLDEKVSRDDKYNLPEGKYFMIVLIFIQNDDGLFLLQKTSKSRNSCIATTGGHVTYGDSSIKTVIKECKEELGLSISKDDIIYIGTSVFKNCFLDTYYASQNIDIDSLIIQEEEVESVYWYSTDEIKSFINDGTFREGNIDPFTKVLNYLKTR